MESAAAFVSQTEEREEQGREEQEEDEEREEEDGDDEEEELYSENREHYRYMHIQKCEYVLSERKVFESVDDLPEEDIYECDCSGTSEADCCGTSCANRLCFVECTPGVCKCGDKCQNMRFQRRQYAAVEMRHTGTGKGYGLFALEDIEADNFIIECVTNDPRARPSLRPSQRRGEYAHALDPRESLRGLCSSFHDDACNEIVPL